MSLALPARTGLREQIPILKNREIPPPVIQMESTREPFQFCSKKKYEWDIFFDMANFSGHISRAHFFHNAFPPKHESPLSTKISSNPPITSQRKSSPITTNPIRERLREKIQKRASAKFSEPTQISFDESKKSSQVSVLSDYVGFVISMDLNGTIQITLEKDKDIHNLTKKIRQIFQDTLTSESQRNPFRADSNTIRIVSLDALRSVQLPRILEDEYRTEGKFHLTIDSDLIRGKKG